MADTPSPKIVCDNVWKVFGPDPQRIIRNWDNYRGLDKVRLLKETGCIVGTRDATLNVELGEIYCLMGLSGSGKSTLLRCINRLNEPTAGRVLIDNQDITALSQTDLREFRRAKTGMVFQHFALLPHRRIINNVAFGLEIQGVSKEIREKKAREALELVGLMGWEKSYPYELSGGMKQRVGLARALATDPEILLMDEAFSALDPLIRRQLQDEFVNLIKKVKKTILFVTHDLNEALRIAGHIAIMKDGAIVQQGTPAEIVLHPAKGYVEEFVRDLPKIKFITAKDIMLDPTPWMVKPDTTVDSIINQMFEFNLRFVFIQDEERRVKNVVDYFKLDLNGADRNILPTEDNLKCDFSVQSALPETFLENLLILGAQTQVPITVTDSEGRVKGIIPRETLLTALTSA
ncbi:MAG: glycine betaine/L-proline ABC transporter ATP-binding protein [Deltaproteobacteria bacterium]|nr:glycine betaine/L-proline ABC transporter ATP-binding protein [Deltaproteobacteria bacterium]